MTEAQVLAFLAEARNKERAESREAGVPAHADGLTYGRARQLALRPSGASEAERLHLAACRHCAHLVNSFRLQTPHLLWWLLLRWVLGRLPADEARPVAQHLHADGCEFCQARCQALRAGRDRVVQLLGPLALPNPQAALASAGELLDVRISSPDRALEGRLVEEEDRVLLRLRTKEPALQNQLLGYQLRGRTGREEVAGVVLLRPDVNGWYAAQAAFPRAELYERLQGECLELLAGPVGAEHLTAAEREGVFASLERGRDPDEVRQLRHLLQQLPP